jgi:hypothetical protein
MAPMPFAHRSGQIYCPINDLSSMVFLVSKLAWDVLCPSVLLLLLSWFGLGLIWTHHLRWGYRLLVAGLSGYLLILLLPINAFPSVAT